MKTFFFFSKTLLTFLILTRIFLNRQETSHFYLHHKLQIFFSSTGILERSYVASVLRSTGENSFTGHSSSPRISLQTPILFARNWVPIQLVKVYPAQSEYRGGKVAIQFNQKSTHHPRIQKHATRGRKTRPNCSTPTLLLLWHGQHTECFHVRPSPRQPAHRIQSTVTTSTIHWTVRAETQQQQQQQGTIFPVRRLLLVVVALFLWSY